jgi:uncharacterized membrane protein YfcA
MMDADTLLLTIGIALIAFLYSTVGHAGASGYIAVMTLAGIAPAVIKPTALVLNILVATIATWSFWRARHFDWNLFWPFAITATPLAFVGGYIALPTRVFKVLVGVVLVVSAIRFLVRPSGDTTPHPPSRSKALPVGGALGLLAGLTGTGGGIFLTPILLFMGWARTKTAAAVSAAFILSNSLAGLAGNLASTKTFPSVALPLGAAALVGGALGAHLGSQRLSHTAIKRLLAVVLLIAGTKLIFTR